MYEFWLQVGTSVAKAIFWLLIIAGVVVGFRIVFKDIVEYLLEDVGEKKKEEGEEK